MDIQEVNVESEVPQTPSQDDEPAEVVVKKGRGRPKGAPNKPKVITEKPIDPVEPKAVVEKTKPKPKARKKITYVEPDESSSDEEPPPRKTRRAAQPTAHDVAAHTQAIAADVLALLSSQRAGQRDTRRSHYAQIVQSM